MITVDRQTEGRQERHGGEPEIIQMPGRKMAVVHTVGEPDQMLHLITPALYSSVHTLSWNLKRVGKDFRIRHLIVRWPAADLLPRRLRHGIWGLQIPAETEWLPQKFPHIEVEIETWDYGTVAQVLHRGGFADDEADIQRLRDFISEKGYQISGALEEEYLAGPEPAIRKVLIRFPIGKQEIITAG